LRSNINIFPPNYGNGSNTLVDLSAGLGTYGGCGALNMFGNFDQYIAEMGDMLEDWATSVVQSIISNIPVLLLCYISQDLCDAYKHFKNQINFLVKMKSASCEQYEQLAMNLGKTLGSEEVSKCVDEKSAAGYDVDTAMRECASEGEQITKPGGGRTTEYSLSGSLEELGVSHESAQLISKYLGDITASSNYGIGTKQKPQYTTETTIAEKKEEIEIEFNNVCDTFSGSVSETARENISMPGFIVTNDMVRKLSVMPEELRKELISQYATVAATYKVLIELEDATEQLETLMNDPKSTEAERKELERQVKNLERKYRFVKEKLDLQARYLDKVLNAIESYQGVPETPYRPDYDSPDAIEVLPSH
jgi:hypothetical protein